MRVNDQYTTQHIITHSTITYTQTRHQLVQINKLVTMLSDSSGEIHTCHEVNSRPHHVDTKILFLCNFVFFLAPLKYKLESVWTKKKVKIAGVWQAYSIQRVSNTVQYQCEPISRAEPRVTNSDLIKIFATKTPTGNVHSIKVRVMFSFGIFCLESRLK